MKGKEKCRIEVYRVAVALFCFCGKRVFEVMQLKLRFCTFCQSVGCGAHFARATIFFFFYFANLPFEMPIYKLRIASSLCNVRVYAKCDAIESEWQGVCYNTQQLHTVYLFIFLYFSQAARVILFFFNFPFLFTQIGAIEENPNCKFYSATPQPQFCLRQPMYIGQHILTHRRCVFRSRFHYLLL